MKKKYILAALFLIALAVYYWSTQKDLGYYQPEVLATHSNGEEFVGSATCMECHKDIHTTHLQTAHYNTSALANAENLKGSFKPDENTIKVGGVEFEMLKEGKSFYQHTHVKAPDLPMPPKKFDIVIASGVKGQSYLNWQDDKLFQLQASYYPPSDSWINSPGFPDRILERPVRDGCLKCHVTFATNRDFSGQGNQYDKAKMLYGVDCERCHRPGAKHVIYHRNNPKETVSKYMLKLDTLARQQRLDVCAQCHSGPRDALLKGNSFSFLSGEDLDTYSRNYYTGLKDSDLDVHGNQYGLLASSKCFQLSTQMDCSTCHDPHKNQRGNVALFNDKCSGCHGGGSVSCAAPTAETQAMGNNCIACHMPNTPSKLMSVQLPQSGPEVSVLVRTHLIGIYSKDE